jgi:short-subunit dehydrogenase
MFAGKRYWIIGASEGLGRALAQALDEVGAHLVISARSSDRLNELAAKLSHAQTLPLDVTDTASVAAAVVNLPPLDGMIYCVGLYDPMRTQNWNQAAALAMVEANFTGALRVLGHILPDFVARDAGHLVLIGSLAGFRGLPAAIGYGASKAALMHLAENLQADLRKTGVKVQLCNPGFIRTRLTAKNEFAMPFIQSPEAAAAEVLRAMGKNRFETSFPRPFSWLFLTARLLPNWAHFRLF